MCSRQLNWEYNKITEHKNIDADIDNDNGRAQFHCTRREKERRPEAVALQKKREGTTIKYSSVIEEERRNDDQR